MHWPATRLPWVMPSPNMPSYETALVYPGGCLIEGTNLSEGRGTTRPFELWGAPWLNPRTFPDPAELAPGILLRPCSFRPTFHKHAGQVCHGLQPHVTDPGAIRPVRLYLALLHWALSTAPSDFAWRTEPYEFVSDRLAIDLLFGNPRDRERLEQGELLACDADWSREEAEFAERRRPYLLY
jgi:uncharacterized protein YbbC (DUF1343 family)